jgi:hypothetical protein
MVKGAWHWNDGQRVKYINATADERTKFYDGASAAIKEYESKVQVLPVNSKLRDLERMMAQYELFERAGALNDGPSLRSTYTQEAMRSQLATPPKNDNAGAAALYEYEHKMGAALAEYRCNAAAILRAIVGNPFNSAMP